ncbi:hypothetical protein CGRA01v4_14556 [Colletotrichum graminicola]|nr:hypothetical protein CGRA01v4_14556 [Colletotrichum graminicola]
MQDVTRYVQSYRSRQCLIPRRAAFVSRAACGALRGFIAWLGFNSWSRRRWHKRTVREAETNGKER